MTVYENLMNAAADKDVRTLLLEVAAATAGSLVMIGVLALTAFGVAGLLT